MSFLHGHADRERRAVMRFNKNQAKSNTEINQGKESDRNVTIFKEIMEIIKKYSEYHACILSKACGFSAFCAG